MPETSISLRPIKRLIKAKPIREGAGVHLRRAFGFGNASDFDPFLLLDDFRNDIPNDYLAGFPWHPHRGIETITYVPAGTVEHGDSVRNHGSIAAAEAIGYNSTGLELDSEYFRLAKKATPRLAALFPHVEGEEIKVEFNGSVDRDEPQA